VNTVLAPLLTLTETIFLACLLIPPMRLAATNGFRRRLYAHRGMSVFIALAPVGYLGGIVLLALFFPFLLHFVFLMGLCAWLAYEWRARADYGRARGLPPGTLRMLLPDQWDDQEFYAKHFARYGPVFKMNDLYRPAACMLGISRARAFLDEHRDALRVPPFPFGRFIPGGFLRFTDAERHTTYRPYFQHAFTLDVYRIRQEWIEETMRAHFQAWAKEMSNVGLYLKPYIQRMLQDILARLFFGLMPDTPDARAAQNDFVTVTPQNAHRVSDESVKRALIRLKHMLKAQAARETCFASEMERAHPNALQDDFLAYNLIYFQILARNDLTGLFYWMLQMLVHHPEWLAQLRAADAPPDLATRIVLETLRMEQSEFLIRQATRDLRFENFVIPKGWFVRLCIRESHRSSDAFAEPARFNPDRFLTHRPTREEYMPFGAFEKACLGEALTLKLGTLFVTELARGYDWRVTQSGPPEFSGNHWQPSSALQIILTPRASSAACVEQPA
jgi:cytochrome P450